MNYEELMSRAISLAARGHPSPNPKVGAVIYKDGRVIGEGFHRKKGEAHAEVEALAACSEDPSGSVLVVTLEPCCHSGKEKLTPPCTDAIIFGNITTVVVGSLDPNPLVSGRGVERLRKAGIRVIVGVMQDECLDLNLHYIHHRRTGRPFVHLKMAQTLDGFAAFPGGGGAITGEVVRREVHLLRADYQAVLVGSGTVRQDKPQLNVRAVFRTGSESNVTYTNPIKIILNSGLDLDPEVSTFSSPDTVWIIGGEDKSKEKLGVWQEAGIPVILLPLNSDGRIDLPVFLEVLGQRGIISLLVEGGPQLAKSFLDESLVDEFSLYLSPRYLGAGLPVITKDSSLDPSETGLRFVETRTSGSDLLIRFYRQYIPEAESCLQG
ncbi:MAG: bifunctional diaminohydroxyphosphoribosylaminopyrimidine deaminase/5-amino-6-(5-phosphoribosylamino)uracil reductase RibD [Spirochaetales bacterium]|nr:bifunctional diaminohydroxyphosphoribosylaminopyrimidine deaminase/5-amino-6-(5-phosphoribosylamino)uracil reductase RibD [Spirochaetales bacterium]